MKFNNPSRLSKPKVLALAVAASTGLSAEITAETFVLEELIVTAQKREQSLQDVPVSVSVVSGEAIEEAGIADLEGLSAQIPNLAINQSPHNLSIYIRGLGSRDNQGFEQSVGLFVDGIYAGRSKQFQAPLMDLAAVEVLRGPQGTLFGKNTIAGAMTVTSAKPDQEFEAKLSTSYEPGYDSYSVEGMISGELAERLSGRLVVNQSESGGYLNNYYLNVDEPDNLAVAARATLLWLPTDNLEVIAKYEWGRSEGAGRNYRLDETGPWLSIYQNSFAKFNEDDEESRYTDIGERSNTNNESLTLTLNYNLGYYALTSITGYSEYQFNELVDGDQSTLDALVFPQAQDFHQWSQEIRLTSPVGDEFDFIAGVYFQTADFTFDRGIHTRLAAFNGVNPMFAVVPEAGAVGTFDQKTDSYAVYGSATWHLSEAWHLTAGLRYTLEKKEAQRNMHYTGYRSDEFLADVYNPADPAIAGLPANAFGLAVGGLQGAGLYQHDLDGDRKAENFSPSLKLQYDVNADLMLYASISQAFKSGGFNAIGNTGDEIDEFALTPETFDYDEEQALALEIGGKSTFLDGSAQFNFALFRTDYSDLQVSSFQGDVYKVGNAAEAVSQGLELDGSIRLSDTFYLSASLAYLDAYYSEYNNAPCTSAQNVAAGGNCSQDLSDRELANAPEWSGNISLDQVFDLRDGFVVRANVNLAYVAEQYLALDLDSNTQEESHTTFNGRLALSRESEDWELALVGKNLTDESIRTWSNDPFLVEGAFFSYFAPPRTIEVQFSMAY